MVERGTVLIVSAGGGLAGKPRPAVVVQASQFNFPETLIVVPLTSTETEKNAAMLVLLPDMSNGLSEASSLMTHRIGAVRKSDIGKKVGSLSVADMERIDGALSLVLGLQAS